jgi:hypothetical protein
MLRQPKGEEKWLKGVCFWQLGIDRRESVSARLKRGSLGRGWFLKRDSRSSASVLFIKSGVHVPVSSVSNEYNVLSPAN